MEAVEDIENEANMTYGCQRCLYLEKSVQFVKISRNGKIDHDTWSRTGTK
jgi:hypothetical protein